MAQQTLNLAQQLAAAEHQRDEARTQYERYRRVLESLFTISVASRGHSTYLELFELAYRELRSIFQLDACYLAVCDMRQPDLFRAAYIVDEDQVKYVENSPHGTLTGMLVAKRAPLLFRDLADVRGSFATPPSPFGDEQKLSRAWAGVPMLLGDDAVGVISLQSYTPDQFDDNDLDLLQRLGNVVGVAIANITLSQLQTQLRDTLAQRVAARTEELASLGALATEMVLGRPLSELLDRALEIILPLLNFPAGNIRRYEPDTNTLVLLAQRGIPSDDARAVLSVPVEGTAIGSIVRNNQPLLIPTNLTSYSLLPRPSQFESLFGVPLRIGERVLGTLSVLDTQPHKLERQQLDLLQVIGNQVALAIENARLLEEAERQIAELRALGRISHAAATAHEPKTLLHQVHAALAEFMRLDVFLMALYDYERDLITAGIGIDEGREYVYFDNQPPPAHSLTGWVIRERRLLHIKNMAEELSQYPGLGGPALGSGRNSASWLGVPVVDRANQIIGVISVQGYTAAAFSERDERFVESVAGQVALHVQNVQLLADRERRIRELDAIGQIGQIVSASYDLTEMLNNVTQHLQALTDATILYLVICEENTSVITHSVYIDSGNLVPDDWLHTPPRSGSLTEWVLRNQRALLLRDMHTQMDEMAAMGIDVRRLDPEHNPRSWIGVPVLAQGGAPIGVISVQDHLANQYNTHTGELLSQVASHLSLGVQKVRLFQERERQIAENARLFEAEQAARRTADTLRDVARVLGSSFDPSEVPQMIIHELGKVIPYDAASILLFDGVHLRMSVQGGDITAGLPANRLFKLDELNAAAQVIAHREPRVIADTRSAAEWTPVKGIPPMRSWLGAPLIAKGQVLGVLNISALAANRFTTRDAEVAFAFASQAAVAMENARLYQESVAAVEQELAIASQIQRNLFPRTLPQVAGLELAAWIHPARETGGDFYDVLVLRDEKPERRGLLAFMVGDASGKSIPAAMLMAVARSIARSEASDHQNPPDVMRETNRWVALDVPPRSFVALNYATLDLATQQLALANAGQLSPLCRRANGDISYLEAPGITLPLGIVPDIEYAALAEQLAAGDLVVFYTDGIVEAKNAQGELFGFERLEELVRKHGALAPDKLIAHIVAAVDMFAGERPQHDDMTLVVLRLA